MTGPRRVCFPFIGDSIGGSHVSALALIRNLDPRRYQPLVVLHEVGPLADHLQSLQIPFKHLPVADYVQPKYTEFEALRVLAQTTPALVRLLRQNRIDLIHTNDFRMHCGWALGSRLAGARLVWHQRTSGFKKNPVKNLLGRLTHRVICISRYTSLSLPAVLAARSTIIDNPLESRTPAPDRTLCRQNLEQELQLPPGHTMIGFFGNLRDRKRPLIFVEAAGRMCQNNGQPFTFLLFGTDRHNYAPQVHERAKKLGIENSIHLMGFRIPVEPWLAACDLVLAPAIDEGFGRVLVESMSVGTAVVAANSGGHSEIISHGTNGMLVPPDNAEAMAQAAMELLDNPASRLCLVERAAACAKERYSVERHVATIMTTYDELLYRPKRLTGNNPFSTKLHE